MGTVSFLCSFVVCRSMELSGVSLGSTFGPSGSSTIEIVGGHTISSGLASAWSTLPSSRRGCFSLSRFLVRSGVSTAATLTMTSLPTPLPWGTASPIYRPFVVVTLGAPLALRDE